MARSIPGVVWFVPLPSQTFQERPSLKGTEGRERAYNWHVRDVPFMGWWGWFSSFVRSFVPVAEPTFKERPSLNGTNERFERHFWTCRSNRSFSKFFRSLAPLAREKRTFVQIVHLLRNETNGRTLSFFWKLGTNGTGTLRSFFWRWTMNLNGFVL